MRKNTPRIFSVTTAQVLAANHRAAGGQGGKDLDNQHVDAVHQAYAGNGRFAYAGNHQRVGHAHCYAQHLFNQHRPDQRRQPLPVEQRGGPGDGSLHRFKHFLCQIPQHGCGSAPIIRR